MLNKLTSFYSDVRTVIIFQSYFDFIDGCLASSSYL